MAKRVAASFRDPDGFVFFHDEYLLRQVNNCYRDDYDQLMNSGLYDQLVDNNYLIRHTEVDHPPLLTESAYKVLLPERLPYISYPYEWSFSQLKDAALLILRIQKEALKAGMILKDASAYNIQFFQGQPILIDTLSFTRYRIGDPWVAYRQFCQHFLAPLALMSLIDIRLNSLMVNYIDGIPLDLCCRLLPISSRFKFGLLAHIHLHAQAQKRYAKTSLREPTRYSIPEVSQAGLIGLVDSLENSVMRLYVKISGSLWAKYYSETNYTTESLDAKKRIISGLMKSLQPRLIFDLGSNTGVFSREAAQAANCLVVSSDIDPEAVELNYRQVVKNNEGNILPLIINLVNPSPGIGWDASERLSIFERGRADVVLALALLHHLAIGNNVPLIAIARTFASLGKHLVLEFVPKEDSQVQRLLSTRDDIFPQYTIEGVLDAFSHIYKLESQITVEGTHRQILLFSAKK